MICNISLHSQIKMSNLLYNLDCTIWLSMNFFLHLLSAPNSPKTKSGANGKFLPKPLLFHLRPPNSKTNESKFWQILSSPKNSFAKTSSALKPHALPEYLEGRTQKEKHPFLFQKKFHPRQNKYARSVFSFGVAGVLASAWGFLRAYEAVSSHHVRGACEVITSLCFGNRCEFGTIQTQVETFSGLGKRSGFCKAKSAH